MVKQLKFSTPNTTDQDGRLSRQVKTYPSSSKHIENLVKPWTFILNMVDVKVTGQVSGDSPKRKSKSSVQELKGCLSVEGTRILANTRQEAELLCEGRGTWKIAFSRKHFGCQ